MLLNPIRKQTVLKTVKNEGKWVGYIAPSKVSPFHVTGGWHIGMEIEIINVWDDLEEEWDYYVVSPNGYAHTLEEFLVQYEVYNCNSELGKRIRFWSVQE